MSNFFKQIGIAFVVATVSVFTGGAFTAAGFSFTAGMSALTFSAVATMAAINFTLGQVLGALAPKSAIAGMRGALITQRDPVASRKIVYGKRRVGGTPVAIGTYGAENKFLASAVVLAAHEVESIEALYFNEERVYYFDGTNYVKDTASSFYDANDQEIYNAEFYLGTDTQTASPTLQTAFPTLWTTDHRLQGVAYVVVITKYDPNKYANGAPNITAVVKGRKVYDPRTESTVYSDNAALCLANYLLDDEYGLGVAVNEIDLPSWTEAANICDESVALDGGGSESRYTANGVVDTALSPKQVIEEMLLSMGGRLVYVNGKFKIIPAEYKTPSVTISEDDIISDITITTKNPTKDVFNGVKGVFANPDALYQPTEYPTIESSAYQTQDGVARYAELNLPYTTSSATAQRLAKVMLNQSRQQVTINMRCNLNALNVTVGDNIYVNNTRLGFSSKVFEVGSVSISPDAEGTIGVDIMAREISESTYDWAATDEQALVTNDPIYEDNYVVPPPTNLSVTSSLVTQPSNVQEVSWEISWTDSEARNFLNYEIQWKKSLDATYSTATTTESSLSGVGGVVSNEVYDVRVRTVTSNGAKSAFATASHTMSGGMTTFTDGEDGAPGPPGATGDSGAGTYYFNVGGSNSVTPGQSTLDSYFATASNSKTKVEGDVLVLRNDNDQVQAYIYNDSTNDWDTQTAFIDGDLLVNGTLTVDKLKSGNLSTNVSFQIGDGTQVAGFDTGAAFISNNSAYASAIFENTGGGAVIAAGTINSAVQVAGFYNATSGSYGAFNSFVELASTTYAINAQGKIVVGGNDAIADTGVANFGGTVYGLSVSNNASYYIMLHPAITNGYYYSRKDADFRYNPATNVVTIGGTASPFTGSHEALIANTEAIAEGDIVVDSSIVAKKDISNVLTLVTKSTSTNQKSAIGVFSTKTDDIPIAIATTQTVMTQVSDGSQPLPDADAEYAEVEEVTRIVHSDYTSEVIGKDYCLINAVGEGQINVCNEGGNIEVGDLIVTSSMAGKGMKQADDFVRGYTVAKARESATFSSDDDVRQIACIYLCG